jgi:F0F1-type ATP synthase membrane subunit b/b'
MNSTQRQNEIPAWFILLLFLLFLIWRWKGAKEAAEKMFAKPEDPVEQLRMEISQLKTENERLKPSSAIMDAEERAAQIIAEAERKAKEIVGDASRR